MWRKRLQNDRNSKVFFFKVKICMWASILKLTQPGPVYFTYMCGYLYTGTWMHPTRCTCIFICAYIHILLHHLLLHEVVLGQNFLVLNGSYTEMLQSF